MSQVFPNPPVAAAVNTSGIPIYSAIPFSITNEGTGGVAQPRGLAAGVFTNPASAQSSVIPGVGTSPIRNFQRSRRTGTVASNNFGFNGGGSTVNSLMRGTAARPMSFEINHLFGYNALSTVQCAMFCCSTTATSDAILNVSINGDGNITGNGRLQDIFGFVADNGDANWSFVNRVGNVGAAVKTDTLVARNTTTCYLMRIRVNPTQASATIMSIGDDGTATVLYTVTNAGDAVPVLTLMYFYSIWCTNNATTTTVMDHGWLFGYTSPISIAV